MIKNVTEYLDKTVQIFPEKAAFCYEDKAITFRVLREQARRIATAIISRGLFRKPVAVAAIGKLNALWRQHIQAIFMFQLISRCLKCGCVKYLTRLTRK